MFKLLIIDDEDNTREGIVESICWSEIGIGHIEQADDGVNALKKAVDFQPDIILTDVRMPRMDGIELSFKLREKYPECVIVFMSGYADKEYLKSAIQLKAVNYLEKPINLKELNKAVKEAVHMCIEIQKKKEAEINLVSNLSLVKNELALSLLKKSDDNCLIDRQLKAARLDIAKDTAFTTVLVKFFLIEVKHPGNLSLLKSSLAEELKKITMKWGIGSIYAFKDEHSIAIHLYADLQKEYLLTPDKLKNISCEIAGYLGDSYKYFISIGKKVNGIANTYASYESAFSTLRKAFFEGYNCILISSETNRTAYQFDPALFQEFKHYIETQSYKQAIFFIKKISSDIKRFIYTPLNNIRDFYFRLLLILCKSAENLHFPVINDFSDQEHIWEYFFKIRTLYELESSLICYIEKYFKILDDRNSSNGIINIVKTYINENYYDEALCISKISDSIHLAPTYLCSLFKEKSGITINQYITEIRIEKSKDFLLNTKHKISDVSSMVGLRDQGYFTKIFRKNTGMTPSQYILSKRFK